MDTDYKGFLELLVAEIAQAISEARAGEEERRRIEQLSSSEGARSDFLKRVDSELRNLSTLLAGPLDQAFATAGETFPDQQRVLEMGRRNGLRALKRINTLLDFAALETGRTEAFYVPVDLSAITAELAGTCRALIEREGVRFFVECPELPEPAYVDRDIWEKIVLSLISNALKFASGGEIGVSLCMTGERFDLVVWDTGIRIPGSKLATLLDGFSGDKSDPEQTFEGQGIGLPLVREFVKLHGGSLRILSEESKGSRIIASIPAGKAHLPQERVGRRSGASFSSATIRTFIEEALPWPAPSPERFEHDSGQVARGWFERTIPSYPEARIIIADDNAGMRDYLRRLLGALYSVEAVTAAEQAVAAAGRHRLDLFLVDASSPRYGIELIRSLRSDSATNTVPVVLLSSVPGEEYRLKAFAAGADDYLLKPFTTRELLFRVQSQIIRKKAKEGEGHLRAET